MLDRLRRRYHEVALMAPELKSPRAYVNWARSAVELRRGTSEVRARPLKLTIDTTNVCQLRCPLCPTGLQVHDRPNGHASLEMLQRLLDELAHDLFFIDFFNWGEPLLNTHLEDFIRLASARNVICTVSTNLSLPLSDERIDRLISSGLREMIVSLDGASQETYGQYRRRGNFDLVCSNMRRIAEAKRRLGLTSPLISWQFLVFAFNEHEIEKAQRLAVELGADRILVRPAFLDVDRFPMSDDDKARIAAWKPKNELYQIETLTAPAAAKHHSRCGWHYTSAAVNWDGSVAPCCTTFEQRHDFGTIADGSSYMEVVNNRAFRAVRDRFAGRLQTPVAEVCEHCPTPAIMDYHVNLNRQILLFTTVAMLERVRRLLWSTPRIQPAVPQVNLIARGASAAAVVTSAALSSGSAREK